MRTKDTITGALILGACLAVGDKLWTIALAAALILIAAVVAVGKEVHRET